MLAQRHIGTAIGILIAVVAWPSSAIAAATALWMPINDGKTWKIQRTETWTDSLGASGAEGPTEEPLTFSPIRYAIFDHVATHRSGDNAYFLETANGLSIVADGNPNENAWFEYYVDPMPFLIRDPLPENEAAQFNGHWRGQWELPGGGYQAWTGQWTLTVTNVGAEVVTTPFGTYEATVFTVGKTDDKSPDGVHVASSVSADRVWVVQDQGIVKYVSDSTSQSDYDGDSISDYSQHSVETLFITAVPEPATLGLMFTGVALVIGVGRLHARPRTT